MKDKMFERAKSWDDKPVPKVDGKGHETNFPRQNPGDSATHRPSRTGPHVPSNTSKEK